VACTGNIPLINWGGDGRDMTVTSRQTLPHMQTEILYYSLRKRSVNVTARLACSVGHSYNTLHPVTEI
jgi:hypothetical protein